METDHLQSPATLSTNRWLFPLAWFLVLVGIVAYAVQFQALQQYVVPWYAPILGTFAIVLMLLAVIQRWTILRIVGLVLATLLVAFEWVFLLMLSLLPAYAGPAAGQRLPAFSVFRADGTTFTDQDLVGQPTIILFFRGHW